MVRERKKTEAGDEYYVRLLTVTKHDFKMAQ